MMQQLPLHASAGWLLVNLAITVGLLLIYSRIPLPYRQLILKLRWVLLPYLALLTGGISPRLMGLTGIDWRASIGFGLGLIAAVLGLLVLARSTTDFSPLSPHPERRNSDTPPLPLVAPSYPALSLSPLINAGAEEFYWSFLRGALWETGQALPVLTNQLGYWAIWVAAFIALPELLRFHPTVPGRLIKVLLLLLTTVLFLYTQNFWLCWLLHALVLLLLIP